MSELQEQIHNRRRKLEELGRQGVELYPHAFAHDFAPSEVHARWDERSAEELETNRQHLRVPGRLRGIRRQGKVMFLDLDDGRGKLQLFVRRPQLPEKAQQLLD
ncbi:MAG TPA: lysine--tRNA ligase, partial [Thermoanaerobaculia bacterium]|nr:lysine--tRNA ligase [Thermoanaerobaculia bacterium]